MVFNFEQIKDKKHLKRYLTFILLIPIVFIYFFIGFCSHYYSNSNLIWINNLIFYIINYFLYIFILWEIWKLIKNENTKIYYFLLFLFINSIFFWLPLDDLKYKITSITPFDTMFNWLLNNNHFLLYSNLFYLFFILFNLLIFVLAKLEIFKSILIYMLLLLISLSMQMLIKSFLISSLGWSIAIYLFIIIFASDTFAFIGGSLFGKHKLAPNISPNKTIEGFISGVFVASILSIAYSICFYYLDNNKTPFINIFNLQSYWIIILLSLYSIFLSLFSQFGDLFFSWIKRKNNIKDFGNVLPGHGGILDRFDSILTVYFIVFLTIIFV